MENRIIYLKLKGRIGNQIFMYAMARYIQLYKDDGSVIIIDDSEVCAVNWENSLMNYCLKDVEYMHTTTDMKRYFSPLQRLLIGLYHRLKISKNYVSLYRFEERYKNLFNKLGLILCENGFQKMHISRTRNIYLEGYFQSELYFNEFKTIIREDLRFSHEIMEHLPNYELLKKRNSICISIKVEHNVGNSMYDVCNDGYYERAIEYMLDKVENPLIFLCSDNVDYVREHLIDCKKYDVIYQDKTLPVHLSLALMSCCKHFIIGNTSFGWWAQYLSDYKDKIVVAPSRWMGIEMPIDIYQDNWVTIEV